VIEAVRWRPFLRWFAGHATGRLCSSFESVHVRGLEQLRREAEEAPLLLLANHTAWWDSLLALWVSQTRLEGVEAYGMMDASNLRRLRFFRWLGAFGVDRSSRRDGALAARYALELLRRRGTALWMFPQGEEQPPHVALRFQPGAAGIARRSPAVRVIPVAFAYVFRGDERPHAYISVGPALSRDRSASPIDQARAVDHERTRIQRQLETGAEGFVVALEQRPSWVAAVATACLDRVAGWMAPRQHAARRALPPTSAPRVDAVGPETPAGTEP